jgi:hypothetical protein
MPTQINELLLLIDEKCATKAGTPNLLVLAWQHLTYLLSAAYLSHRISIFQLLVFNRNAFWHGFRGPRQQTRHSHLATALVLRSMKSPSHFSALIYHLPNCFIAVSWCRLNSEIACNIIPGRT